MSDLPELSEDQVRTALAEIKQLKEVQPSVPNFAHLSQRQRDMSSLELTLRKRIHIAEKHNQYFERCESAWCNPDLMQPSVQFEDWWAKFRDSKDWEAEDISDQTIARAAWQAALAANAAEKLWVTYIDEVPDITTGNNFFELSEEITPAEVVIMWAALKKKYLELKATNAAEYEWPEEMISEKVIGQYAESYARNHLVNKMARELQQYRALKWREK